MFSLRCSRVFVTRDVHADPEGNAPPTPTAKLVGAGFVVVGAVVVVDLGFAAGFVVVGAGVNAAGATTGFSVVGGATVEEVVDVVVVGAVSSVGVSSEYPARRRVVVVVGWTAWVFGEAASPTPVAAITRTVIVEIMRPQRVEAMLRRREGMRSTKGFTLLLSAD